MDDVDDTPHEQSSLELVASDPRWTTQFDAVSAALSDALGARALRIEHIGSTAVPGLIAKPTIDVLLVVADTTEVLDRVGLLASLGFEYRPDNWPDPTLHLFFQRVIIGRRTHHLHVVPSDSTEIDDYLSIRDYLRAHSAEVDAYGAHKLALQRDHNANRSAYVVNKPNYVEPLLARATAWRRSVPVRCGP